MLEKKNNRSICLYIASQVDFIHSHGFKQLLHADDNSSLYLQTILVPQVSDPG